MMLSFWKTKSTSHFTEVKTVKIAQEGQNCNKNKKKCQRYLFRGFTFCHCARRRRSHVSRAPGAGVLAWVSVEPTRPDSESESCHSRNVQWSAARKTLWVPVKIHSGWHSSESLFYVTTRIDCSKSEPYQKSLDHFCQSSRTATQQSKSPLEWTGRSWYSNRRRSSCRPRDSDKIGFVLVALAFQGRFSDFLISKIHVNSQK